MSKNLNTVLGFAKVIRIVTKVLFIICIVSGSITLVGAIASWTGIAVLSIDGAEVNMNIIHPEAESAADAAAECLIDAITCASEAIILGFTTTYFKNMLDDKTPFTEKGSKELLRLGIISVGVPTVCSIACELVSELLTSAPIEASNTIGDATTVVGVLLIFLSFVIKYGAELEENKKNNG